MPKPKAKRRRPYVKRGRIIKVRRCRFCGCTETTPCVNEWGETCSWVAQDLCSACAGE
jgi:hypothetical protein